MLTTLFVNPYWSYSIMWAYLALISLCCHCRLGSNRLHERCFMLWVWKSLLWLLVRKTGAMFATFSARTSILTNKFPTKLSKFSVLPRLPKTAIETTRPDFEVIGKDHLHFSNFNAGFANDSKLFFGSVTQTFRLRMLPSTPLHLFPWLLSSTKCYHLFSFTTSKYKS